MRKFNFKYLIHNTTYNRGFSFVELMVVLVIIGILASGAVFMFSDPTAKVKAAAFEMRGDFNLARAEAVRRNEGILVQFVFNACGEEDVTSGVCSKICGKSDKDSFEACYSSDGTNNGYVLCFDESGDDDCQDEVRTAPPATQAEVTDDLKNKIVKAVLFNEYARYYAIGTTPPPDGPSSAPNSDVLTSNNGITFSGDYFSMFSDGRSSDKGTVVIYYPSEGKIKGKPYAVIVDNASTGQVRLERWRPDLGAGGEWSKK